MAKLSKNADRYLKTDNILLC